MSKLVKIHNTIELKDFLIKSGIDYNHLLDHLDDELKEKQQEIAVLKKALEMACTYGKWKFENTLNTEETDRDIASFIESAKKELGVSDENIRK